MTNIKDKQEHTEHVANVKLLRTVGKKPKHEDLTIDALAQLIRVQLRIDHNRG